MTKHKLTKAQRRVLDNLRAGYVYQQPHYDKLFAGNWRCQDDRGGRSVTPTMNALLRYGYVEFVIIDALWRKAIIAPAGREVLK